MIFGKYSYSNLHISNDLLHTISGYKDLGVLITENLKFKNHISLICFKASKKINILFHAFHTNSYSSILKAYLTYARPLLKYSSPLWNPPYDCTQCKLIEKIQLKFTKRLFYRCNLDLKLNYTQILSFLNVNSLQSRRRHAIL